MSEKIPATGHATGHATGGERRALYSVAQIQHILRTEFHRAQRYRYPLACLVLSVDPLGEIRDRLGYDAKEAVLDAIVALVTRTTRASDFLGRTADDRLLAIVPHTDAAGAATLSTRLVEGARVLEPLRALASPRLTLSLGFAATDGSPVSYHDELLAAAEAAHAEAASLGGDRWRAPGS